MNSKVIIFSALVIFLIIELLKRVSLFRKGYGFFRKKRFVNPWFTAYDPPPPQEKNGYLYFKKGQVATKYPEENAIRIICLGDSTTINTMTKTHYPAVLQERLNCFYKKTRFEVLNAGADAFTTAHSLVNFSLRLLYFKPECIIVYHNINDLSANFFLPFLKTDYSNKYFINLFLAPECKLGLQKCFFSSRLLSGLMMKWNNFIFEKKALALKENIDISLGKEVFKNNLKNIISIAKLNKIKVILGTQAACFSKDSAMFSYIKKEHFCEYNNVIRLLAEEEKIMLADCFGALGQNAVYFSDLVHYTNSGVNKLSDVFFKAVRMLYPDTEERELSKV